MQGDNPGAFLRLADTILKGPKINPMDDNAKAARERVLAKAMEDAMYRIGSAVAGGAERSDPYVQQQITKIVAWNTELEQLLTPVAKEGNSDA